MNRIPHASGYLRSGRIAEFLQAVERRQHLLAEVRSLLPAPLDTHCTYAGLEAGVLTLVTDSPAWGSRLRFFAPELIRGLTPRHGPVASCRVRIQPASANRELDSEHAPRRLSEATVRNLLEAADGLGDSNLGRALRRLARSGAARKPNPAP
jgi:hypothetical protein